MMKKIILLVVTVVSMNSKANVSISTSCLNEDNTLELLIDQNYSQEASYSVFDTKSGKELGSGTFTLAIAGYDSFLETVFFAYSNGDSIVGISIATEKFESLESIPNGLYKAYSDAFVTYESGAFDGSTLSCKMSISHLN